MADDHEEGAPRDELIKSFLAGKWHEATDSTKSAMEALRSVYPDLSTHLNEMGGMHIEAALSKVTAAYNELNQLGRHILGDEAYERYLDDQVSRRIDA